MTKRGTCHCNHRLTGGEVVDGVHSSCGLPLRTSMERFGEIFQEILEPQRVAMRNLGYSEPMIRITENIAVNSAIRDFHRTTNIAGMGGPSTLQNGDDTP